MKKITVAIGDERKEVPFGTTVGEALAHFGLQEETRGLYSDNPFVCALAHCIPRSLSSPLVSSCSLSPVRLFSDIGKRCYRQSLLFLIAAAARKVFPRRRLVIGYALGDGYYLTFDDNYLVTNTTVDQLASEMWSIVEEGLPITERIVPYGEALDYFRKQGATQTVSLLSASNEPTVTLQCLGSFMDTSYEPLVSTTALLSLWELRLYKGNGLLLRYPRSFDYTKLDTFKDNSLLFKALQQNREEAPILQIHSIGELSKLSQQGKISPLIRLCEEAQEKKIADIADTICERGTVRFVFIAGPSSSGKTTFAYKLCTQLEVRGKRTIKLSLDNYYFPSAKAPRNEEGKPDLERIEALNIPLFHRNLADLVDGEAVRFPKFDFISQETTFQDPVKLGRQTILVIEGIHGMNPLLCGKLDRELLFRVYISAFTQVNIDDHNRISTTDNRIIRRIVRDHRTRGSSAEETLAMFPSVQRGENLYIFPYQNNADVMMNSALDYELAVLAPLAEPLLRMVKPAPDNVYITSRRLIRFLSHFQSIPITMVPHDSLLREFIGGSEYGVT